MVIKDKPCKVIDMSTFKTGKHGPAKIHFIAVDIFTGKKCEELCASTNNVHVPNINRHEYILVDIMDDDFCSCLDTKQGETKDDLELPEGDMGKKIRQAFDDGKEVTLTVLSAMGYEQIHSFRITQ